VSTTGAAIGNGTQLQNTKLGPWTVGRGTEPSVTHPTDYHRGVGQQAEAPVCSDTIKHDICGHRSLFGNLHHPLRNC